MDCNMEANLVKRRAEELMLSNDFVRARDLVLKALQLSPEMENIHQLLTVCEVLCSSSKFKGHSDWYAVLQVHPEADEFFIKKQYRKLALLLHPDKNKFPGAEAAFMLISEAHRVLSDPGRRAIHDVLRRNTSRMVLQGKADPQPQTCKANNHGNGASGCSSVFNQFAQPPMIQSSYSEMLSRKQVPNSNGHYDPGNNLSSSVNGDARIPSVTGKTSFPRRNSSYRHHFSDSSAHNSDIRSRSEHAPYQSKFRIKINRVDTAAGTNSKPRIGNAGERKNISPTNRSEGFEMGKDTYDIEKMNFVEVKKRRLQDSVASWGSVRTRSKMLTKESHSFERENNERNGGFKRTKSQNTSGRNLRNVGVFSYEEDIYGEKCRRGLGSLSTDIEPTAFEGSQDSEGRTEKLMSKGNTRDIQSITMEKDTSSKSSSYHNSDLVNDIPADTSSKSSNSHNSLPINEIFTKESNQAATDKHLGDIVEPLESKVNSSTHFVDGQETENVGCSQPDILCPSCPMNKEKVTSSKSSTHYNLFLINEIPTAEQIRAATDEHLGDFVESLESKVNSSTYFEQIGGLEFEEMNQASIDEHVRDVGEKEFPPTSPGTVIYPIPEFHNFLEDKAIEKFRTGDIWAAYSSIDEFPNYYGIVQNVDLNESKVHVKWLEPFRTKEAEKDWYGRDLPLSCGMFKIEDIDEETEVFDSTDSFSHCVHAIPSVCRNSFKIYPREGEVWALFKNWSIGWTLSDLNGCEYDLAEVVDCTDTQIDAVLLIKMDGYTSIFHSENDGVQLIMEVKRAELLRFSHQVPAFQLTEEGGGKLRGCWELDPASVPRTYLSRRRL